MTSQKLVPYKRKAKPAPVVVESPDDLLDELEASPVAQEIRDRREVERVNAERAKKYLEGKRIHASPVVAYMGKLRSEDSRRTMMTGLKQIAAFFGSDDPETFPWWTLTYAHTNALAAHLAKTYDKPETANAKLYALRGVLKACARIVDQHDVPLMTYDACMRAMPDQIAGESLTKGRALERYELDALFGACSGPLEKRDKALLALLFGCGLRRSELAGAEFVKYHEGILRVRGKGNKEREQPVPPGARRSLEAWLEERGQDEGPLLYSCKGRVLAKTAMTGDAILKRLRELAKIAGIEKLRAHDLRRSFATALFDADTDPITVMKLMGHKSLSTTMKYDKRGERAKRAAAEMFEVPE